MSEENNTFDVNQLGEALNNEEVRGQIFETLQGNENSKELLDKYAKAFYDENVGIKIGELHGMYDKDFEEITGQRKPEGVKTYQFIKEKVKELHEKANSVDTTALDKLKQENEALKSKVESGDVNNHFKSMYEEGKTTWQQQIAEKEEIIKNFQAEKKNFGVMNDLNSAMSSLSIREDIPESVTKVVIKNVLDKYIQNSTIENDNSVTYYDGENKPLMNKKTVNKLTAKEILQDELKDILVKKSSTVGGKDKANDNPLSGVANVSAELSSCKTRIELNEAINNKLLSDGVKKGSDEFKKQSIELFKQYGEELPLR